MQSTPETSETNESLGAYLKKSREGKNVSIEQVAYATRISLKMLRALEEDDHTALPAPTFVRGYLQAYAKYVRIDTQDLLLRYQHHLATAPDAKRSAIRSHYLYVPERYQEKRRLVFVIVLFAILLSSAGAYIFLKAQHDKRKRLAHTAEQIQKSEEQKPGVPASAESPLAKDVSKPSEKPLEKPAEKIVVKEKEPEAPVVEKKAEKAPAPVPPPVAVTPEPPKPAPVPVAPPAPAAAVTPETKTAPAEAKPGSEKKNFQLSVKAREDVWFRYQTDEDEVKDLTLRSGKTMTLRANKVFKIFSGNLGALAGVLNGKEIAQLATSKGVKSVVLPDSETANYKLPLFPQFQTKRVAKPVAAEQNKPASDAPKDEKTNEISPVPPSNP